ncbi:MAG TPA: RnfABCDGE type electron transport complex subunit G [Candidatus Krumholzibacteriaceae bacterium]|nr:RnfABCDGE type electron transport complex subunit G [Candidatus Krumholzibacteriaceae bacterium]
MKEIFRLTLVLTVITAVSAGVLAFVSYQTEEPIRKALQEEKMTAARNVLPPFDNKIIEDRKFVVNSAGDTIEVFRGKKDGKITGAAFPVISADGYSGDIEFLVGVNRDGVIQGVEILKHSETPGLGAKIQSGEFRDQFEGHSIDNTRVWEVKKDGGEFEQITGATISSRAVTRAIRKGLNFYETNIDEITGGADRLREGVKQGSEEKD